jgi:hypothetical protein
LAFRLQTIAYHDAEGEKDGDGEDDEQQEKQGPIAQCGRAATKLIS